jgi:protein-glutamine gamma-glutamyltransferase
MKIPPLLLGTVTVYWGINSGWFVFSIVAALVFELNVVVKTRFDLKDYDFIKISDLCSVIMLILLFYSYLENEPRRIFLYFISTMPIVFMPLLFAQLYSTSDKVVIGTTFGKGVHKHKPIDVRGLYLISVFIASASADNRSLWFFPVTVFLILWSLYGGQDTTYKIFKYLSFSIAVFVFSFGFVLTIEKAHLLIRDKMMEMYRNWYQSLSEDPYKTTTAMGETGYLKLSGEIVMRITPQTRTGIPLYLKTADYNTLSGSTWHARSENNRPVFPDGDMSWQIFGESKGDKSLVVSKWMGKQGQGLLALPSGSNRTEKMDVAGIEISGLGAVKIDEGPDLLDYTVFYSENTRYEPPPETRDIVIPDFERNIIEKIIAENDLKGWNDLDSVMRIENYFSSFKYSLDLSGQQDSLSVVEQFLTETKSGHCEYFATATVLLLRAVGIPARYSTGYSVSEYSDLEKKLIARERDAHAWVTARVNGEWMTIDTTPSVWYSIDREKRSFLEPVKDFFSWLRIEYEYFRKTKNEEFNRLLIVLASILTFFMMVKIYLRKKKIQKNNPGKKDVIQIQGTDSPLYDLIKKYENYGFEKFDNESIRQWSKRVSGNLNDKDREDVFLMSDLHETLRFDPEVKKKTVLKSLTDIYNRWLKKITEFKKRKKKE